MANTVPRRYLDKDPVTHEGIWNKTFTVAEVTAETAVVVPPVAGKQFVATEVFMRAIGGNLSGPTTVELVETTTGGVVCSHVTADLTSGVWRLTTAGDGTVVTTKWAIPLVVSEGLELTDTGGSASATATHLQCVVKGFYI